ncbi:MAG: universal stress protein [Gemmatimonadetes bacterium]|nr:universal stress protein [Gemmatimonadota bacterium]
MTLVHVQDRARIRVDDRVRMEEFNRIDRGRLKRLRDDLIERGVERVDIEILFGAPAKELVDFSRRGEATMLVVGTQGRGFFGQLVLGGVAHQAARQSSVPTLLVPPKIEAIDVHKELAAATANAGR